MILPNEIFNERTSTLKCVVWDLDGTLWDGILLEDASVTVNPEIREIIIQLDQCGILNSISSRNDEKLALRKLEELALAEYFVCSQINWNPKSDSIQQIAANLNLSLNSFAFVDDQPFELAEVTAACPEVRCIPVREASSTLRRFVSKVELTTEEALRRRLQYQDESKRERARGDFKGTNEDFLKTLRMEFTISKAVAADLDRAYELTLRTNQLNSTGLTYAQDELLNYSRSEEYLLLMADLKDCFGDYGKIGLALVAKGQEIWTIKLLLMSCRVINRGVGSLLLHHIITDAKHFGVRLQAEFLPNERNRMMSVAFGLSGFKKVGSSKNIVTLEHLLDTAPTPPPYVKVTSMT